MKFVNQLKNSDREASKHRASRPVIKPRKNTLKAKQKGTRQDEQFLFI